MKSTVSKALRNIVAERDSYTCILCDNPYADMHHYVPRSRGGRNTPQNLVSLCRPCHMRLHREIPPPRDYCDGEACVGRNKCPGVYHCWAAEMEYRMCEYLADFYAEEAQDTPGWAKLYWNY